MKDFIEHLKGFWFVYGIIAGAAVWIANIDSKTFDSAEQKVEHKTHVEQSLTPLQQQSKYLRDSMNTVHAMTERAKRTKMQRKSDSVHRLRDSLVFDMVERQTIQIEQVKEQLKKSHN